ncbi:MAG: leucine-rich repeat domain-containing protein [Clostridia bacterium]|nr:leucine-rich repeat domain-containing protein [Clostridia bacterium]
MKLEKRNSGITLVSLVVTIIVLLILAGISIRLASNNGIIGKSKTAKEIADKTDVIEVAQLDIMKVRVKNGGSLSEQELIDILTSSDYHTEGTLSDNDEESVLDKILTTKDGKYQIRVSEIYDGKLTKSAPSLASLKTKVEKQSEDCMIDEDGNIIPISVWRYIITGEDTCIIEGYEDQDYGGAAGNAYSGEIIEGHLEYDIPVFIKENNRTYKVNGLGLGALWCLSIEDIEIPNTIETIGQEVFSGCNKLKSIDIKENVREIGRYSFSGCSSLTEVNLPSSLKEISEGMFNRCSNLETIEIPKSVEVIRHRAFIYCENLKNVELPDNLRMIEGQAFWDCKKIEELIIPEKVEGIGYSAFAYCNSISEITIPNSVTTMQEWVFEGWTDSQVVNINFKRSELPDGWEDVWNYSHTRHFGWYVDSQAIFNYLPE